MARPKKKQMPVAPMKAETPEDLIEIIRETQKHLVSKEMEEKHLHCMDCGREFYQGMKIYTAKYKSGAISIVCPVCACKKKIRLKTPYISADAMRRLKIERRAE